MQDDKAPSTTSVFMDTIRIQLGSSSLGCLTTIEPWCTVQGQQLGLIARMQYVR
jgi:hypothetical protein